MPLPLAILLESILNRNLLATQELPFHILNRHIRSIEIMIRDESISFTLPRRRISRNLPEIISPVKLNPLPSKDRV